MASGRKMDAKQFIEGLLSEYNPSPLMKTGGDIYNYAQSEEANYIAGNVLADPINQDLPTPNYTGLGPTDTPMMPHPEDKITTKAPAPIRQKLNFEQDVIEAQGPANIKPDLPFAYKDQPLPAMDAEKPVIPTEPAKPLTDDELANAQKSRSDMMRKAMWLDAANTLGRALTAGGKQADPNLLKKFQDYAESQVTDVKDRKKEGRDSESHTANMTTANMSNRLKELDLKDKEAQNDPESDASKAYRDYVRSYIEAAGANITVDENMSMNDLSKSMGTLGEILKAKMYNDGRKDAAREAALNRAASKENSMLDSNTKYATALEKGLEKISDHKQKADRIKSSLEQAIKNPSGFRDIQAIYDFVKNMDPESAVREGEISLAQSVIPAWTQLQMKVSKELEGDARLLTPEMRKTLLDITSEISAAVDKSYNRKMLLAKEKADARNIPESWYNAHSKAISEKLDAMSPKKENIPAASNLSARDQEALDWANKNPNDSRAKEIKKRLGQ